MFSMRCLSLLLLNVVVFIHCDEKATETLIEMKDDILREEKTTESERLVEDVEGTKLSNATDDELGNLSKDYDRLGKIYVAQFYTLFDDPSKRLSLVSLYHYDDSMLSYEGEKFHGTKQIIEKFQKLNLRKIERSITSVDSQSLRGGGVIINVVGRVEANDNPSQRYAQTFVFKPQKGSFFLQNDIFRTIQD